MQQNSAVVRVHDELVDLVRQLMTDDRDNADAPTLAQHAVLSYIGRSPGCRATEIADAFGVHRSTVSRQIRVFLDRGWVTAEGGPVRVGHPLTLTPTGREALAAIGSYRQAEVAERVGAWPVADVEQFADLLRRFRLATSRFIPDTDGDDIDA